MDMTNIATSAATVMISVLPDEHSAELKCTLRVVTMDTTTKYSKEYVTYIDTTKYLKCGENADKCVKALEFEMASQFMKMYHNVIKMASDCNLKEDRNILNEIIYNVRAGSEVILHCTPDATIIDYEIDGYVCIVGNLMEA